MGALRTSVQSQAAICVCTEGDSLCTDIFEPRWRWIERQAGAMGRRYRIELPRMAAKLERARKLGYARRALDRG